MWYKSEAEPNTALGCFAVSPPCPSSSLCFHRKMAELLALIMPYGNPEGKAREIAAQPAQPFLAETRAHECCSTSLFRTWFSKVSFPSWWQPAPHPCSLLPLLGLWGSRALALQAALGAAGCKHRAQRWLSCSSRADIHPRLLVFASGIYLGFIQGLCWKSALLPTKASFRD